MILSILKKLENDILAESELWDILNSIKQTTASSSANTGYFANPDRKGEFESKSDNNFLGSIIGRIRG